MAVISKISNPSLTALTATALALPGMIAPVAQAAEGDEVDFQYSHYQEGKRDVFYTSYDSNTGDPFPTQGKSFNPIEVDSLAGHGNFALTDRVKFAFNYLQDTWGGATPIATSLAAFGGHSSIFDKSGSTVVGASPYLLTGSGVLLFDRNLKPYRGDFSFLNAIPDDRVTHIMSTASPETRKQGDFKLSYQWNDEATAIVGGGISVEDDYESRFGNLGLRMDLNQKLTTLNLDLSYTNSETMATLDHDASPYIYKDRWFIENTRLDKETGGRWVTGTKQDWGVHAGISQVVNASAVVAADINYTRSTGYMANPYKVTQFYFVDPADLQDKNYTGATVRSFLERRPEVRNQWGIGGRYVQYLKPLDAALHFNYNFSADDWGVQAHTFEADWVQPLPSNWTITPRIRYYSQDAADFYLPFSARLEKYQTKQIVGKDGETYVVPANKLPSAFSSDHRLSGYGTLSGGVTVAKQFSKGITLETGFEYYTHQGSLKLGGDGEGAFADFDFWLANAALKVNLDALSIGGGKHSGPHDSGHHHHMAAEPAGVMFAHMLPKAGDFMVGYRYLWSSQGGSMLAGGHPISDSALVAKGCVESNSMGCFLTPDSMSMTMHMLDLMYAPTDWLNLMLMPQFMDMDMDMRKLDGSSDLGAIDSSLGNHLSHHVQNGHETGGIGDLGMYALVKLYDKGTHHLHATVGLSAPTGDVDLQLRRNHGIDGGFYDYGMQLGSGTWDFKPSLTYTGHMDDWSWGAQANGTVRMESRNKSGYRLGDLFQATAWGSYNLTHWLTASLRGVYTVQGRIDGQYPDSRNQFYELDENSVPVYSRILKFGPHDYPQNYGGRFWDVGFGLSAMVSSGDFAGNKLSVEWLQPVHTDFNGYQLDRDGALSATWSVAF